MEGDDVGCEALEQSEEYLVGGLVAINFIFPKKLGMSSSQLTLIFFRGVAQTPTRIFLKQEMNGNDGNGKIRSIFCTFLSWEADTAGVELEGVEAAKSE